MKIQIGRGIDDIIFGMSESEIIGKLGAPNKRVITENENIDLYFYSHRLVLKIEGENDNRLGWIEIHNKRARWDSHSPWLLNQNNLLRLLVQTLGESFEKDD